MLPRRGIETGGEYSTVLGQAKADHGTWRL